MITVAQASRLLGVTPSRVRALISSGLISAHKVGKVWMVDEESALQRVQEKPKGGRPANGKARLNPPAEQFPFEDFHAFYQQAQECFSHYPSAGQMDFFASKEECDFAFAVADFFLQRKQRQLVAEGAF